MRPRKQNKHLPPCVYLHHGAFWLVKNGKWERLGSELSTALAEYGRRFQPPVGSMDTLIDNALESIRHKLKKNTWMQYQTASRKLKLMLADFSPEQVKAKDIAAVKLALAKTPNMANRCLSVLRQVFDYAVEQQLVDSNPALGIKRHLEQKRERLISQAEYAKIYAKAGPRLQIIMDLLFLTGQRVTDVLTIKRMDLRDEGIYFEQDKTGARLLVRWTPELQSVVKRANELSNVQSLIYLLQNRRRKAPDYSTIKLQWNIACKAAGVVDADLRDLRAMSGTAAEQQGMNPTALLGHTSAQMTKRYLRDKQVPEVDGPSFSHRQKLKPIG